MVKGAARAVVKKIPIAKIGELLFIVGFIAALVVGAVVGAKPVSVGAAGAIVLALAILGIIVGLTTITETEAGPYMLAAVALMVAATFGGNYLAMDNVIAGFGSAVSSLLVHVGAFVAPAAVLISIKAVYKLAHTK